MARLAKLLSWRILPPIFIQTSIIVAHRLFFKHLIPILNKEQGPTWAGFHWFFGMYLTWQTQINFLACAWVDPGYLPIGGGRDESSEAEKKDVDEEGGPDSGCGDDGNERRFCDTCDHEKPPRSHHCKVLLQIIISIQK